MPANHSYNPHLPMNSGAYLVIPLLQCLYTVICCDSSQMRFVKTRIFFYLTIFSSALLCLTFMNLCIFTHIPDPSASKHACKARTQIQSFKESLKTGRVRADQSHIHYPESCYGVSSHYNFQLRLSSWGQSLKPAWDPVSLTSKFLLQPWQGTISCSRRLTSGTGKLGPSKIFSFKLLY